MKARRLRTLLQRSLGYAENKAKSKGGSHRHLEAPGRPDIIFAFHDGVEVGGSVVRTILVRQAGLTLEEAKEVFRRG